MGDYPVLSRRLERGHEFRESFSPRLGKWIATVLFLLSSFAMTSLAQVKEMPGDGTALETHYDQAQKLQAAGNLEAAAKEYRLFLANALGEMAVGMARAGQYPQAVPDFEEAATLAPESPALQLEYAQAALQGGSLERAGEILDFTTKFATLSKAQQARIHLIRGRILVKKNSNAQARQKLEEAVGLDPTFENGYELAVKIGRAHV